MGCEEGCEEGCEVGCEEGSEVGATVHWTPRGWKQSNKVVARTIERIMTSIDETVEIQNNTNRSQYTNCPQILQPTLY